MKKLFFYFVIILVPNSLPQTPQWEFMGLAGEEIYDIAIDDSGNVYVGSEGGVFKTTNYGTDWIFQNNGLIIQNVNKIFIDYEGNIYLAATVTFPPDSSPIIPYEGNRYLAATGASNTGYGLYKSTDGGENWVGIADTLNSNPIYFEDVTIIPNEPGGFIYVSNYYGIYRSTDNGITWQSTNFSHYGAVYLGINTNGYMFFSNETVGWSGIYRSSDLGLNWEIRTSLGFRAIVYLGDGSILAGYNEPGNSGIYKTTNNGDTWFNTNALNFGSQDFVLDTNDDIYNAAGYVFLSTDNGTSWLNYGLPGQGSYNLAIDTSGYIWSGNHLDGVYRTAGRTVPVEFTSFSVEVNGNNVLLSWVTATEINNRGFEIEKQVLSSEYGVGRWETIGFVDGNGTTTEIKTYSFIDENVITGTYLYRLKQIDFDGNFEYSKVIEVIIETPDYYHLSQNYPNPFNPSTAFSYSIKDDGLVSIKVYNILGTEVAELINEYKAQGEHSVTFDGSQLSSGTYFYVLRVNDFVDVKKMQLLK